jgi:drug/metabolite transporter (DMT)-like permease
MSWFLIALVGPILWAIVNHADKYLLSNRFKGRSIASLMVFSTLTSIIVLPILYFARPDVRSVPVQQILILIVVGIISALAIWLYLYALDEDEASVVVPLFQTIPIFGALFAYLFLGETLTSAQMLGCALIICGSMIITLEIDEEQKVRFKRKVMFFMLGSSILFAFYETLFKVAAVDQDFWISSFWEHTGLFLVGLVLLCIGRFRRDFLVLLTKNGSSIVSLNLGSEIFTIIGNVATNYALLIAPVALVLTVSGIQPLIVFLFGIALTLFIPKLGRERLKKAHVLQKLVAIVIMFIGAFMLH